jgi:acetyl-CoA C-acetyltransferase
MKDVVIVSACRTPIGAFLKSLASLRGPELGKIVMKEAIKRAQIDPKDIGDVRFGCCLEDYDALNIARISALLAGVPETVPAITINRVCTSSMDAVMSGAMMIQNGFIDVALCGGVESMSNVPFLLPKMRAGVKYMDTTCFDALSHALNAGSHFIPYPQDGPIEWARGKPYIMGLTAEFLALKYNMTRLEQDEVALRSHNNAQKATEAGKFKDEIVPVEVPSRDGVTVFEKDEHYRENQTMEQLARLKPSFIPKVGTVTAGNSSGMNDGAAAMIIMSQEKADQLGLKPLAKLTGFGMGGCSPELMGLSPVPAVKNLLERTNMKLEDFERIEINEAFASQFLACERELGINREITNVNGSGIALGHPIGCTGARIMVTLLYELIHSNKKTGLATLCGGGGVSLATAIEKL